MPPGHPHTKNFTSTNQITPIDTNHNQIQMENENDDDHVVMPRNVRYSDQRLLSMAQEAITHIDWQELLRADKPRAPWVKQKQKHDSRQSMDIYTRCSDGGLNESVSDSTRPNVYAVLAKQELPCTVQELRLVFHTLTSESFRMMMATVTPDDFVRGEILHHVNVDRLQCRRSRTKSDLASNNEPYESLRELFVKTVVFKAPTVFRSREEWCKLDFIQPIDSTIANCPSNVHGFTRTVLSLAPEDCFVDVDSSTHGKHGHSSVYGYYFQQSPDSDGSTTRSGFYGEFISQHTRKTPKGRASSRTIKTRLIRMAEMMKRFVHIVQRRRLGMQVLADPSISRLVSKTSCNNCTRSFKLSKRRQCALCGQFVCDKCSRLYEREYYVTRTSRSTFIQEVRVCNKCIERISQCNYTDVTLEDLHPATVVPDNPSTFPHDACGALVHVINQALRDIDSEKQTGALNVLKYLSSISMDGTKHPETTKNACCTDQNQSLSIRERLEALEVKLRDVRQQFPIKDCVLANNKKRNYPLTHPDDPAKPLSGIIPPDEAKRLEMINRMQLDYLGQVPELDLICIIAVAVLQCTGGLVKILHREAFHVVASNIKAYAGTWLPRHEGFCSQVAMSTLPLLVPHVQADVRFSRLTAVQALGLNFYCGFPLFAADQQTAIGSLCCIGQKRQTCITQTQYALMTKLAQVASKVVHIESTTLQQRQHARKANAVAQHPVTVA